MYKFLLFLSSFIFLYSCSNSNNTEINIPLTSEVESLVEHSKEFEKRVKRKVLSISTLDKKLISVIKSKLLKYVS